MAGSFNFFIVAGLRAVIRISLYGVLEVPEVGENIANVPHHERPLA